MWASIRRIEVESESAFKINSLRLKMVDKILNSKNCFVKFIQSGNLGLSRFIS